MILIGISLGILIAVLNVDLSFLESVSLWELPVILLLFYAGVFLVINIHELGHLFFGKLLGYDFLMFRAGMLSIQKENGRLRVSLVKNVGYGGLCAMIPGKDATLRDFAVYSTGGILFNTLTGILFLFLAFRADLPGIISSPLFLTGGVSLLLALINAWPFYSMNQPTDGMMFFSILRKSPLAERFYESSLMSKKLTMGVRPRDLELSPPKLPLEDFHDLGKVLYLYFMEMDKGNLQVAGEYITLLEKHLDQVPPYTLPAYYYELIFYYLLMEDQDKARYYHEKAGKILQKDQDINGLRIKAYYAYYVEKDSEKAWRLALAGMAVMEKYPFRGQAIFEMEQLEKLMERIDDLEEQGE